MVTVTKHNIAELLLVDSLSEVHDLRRRVAVYERKYGVAVHAFEERLKNEDESFEGFDDLMDWKACVHSLREAETRVDDLKHGNIQVA